MDTLSAKVPDDLFEAVEEYQEEYDLSRSQATRRLLESGIEAETSGLSVPAWYLAATFGLILFSAAAMESTNPPLHAAIGALVAIGAYAYAIIQANR